jgi:hypothetical protein
MRKNASGVVIAVFRILMLKNPPAFQKLYT